MLDLNLDLNSFEPEKVEINQDIPNAMPGFQNPNIDAEEQKRILAREKEAELREYISEFNQKRQEEIEKRRKALEEKVENKNGENNGEDTWSNVKNNIDLKDSEYKGTKDVQRMREAMMNNPNSQPMQNIFG